MLKKIFKAEGVTDAACTRSVERSGKKLTSSFDGSQVSEKIVKLITQYMVYVIYFLGTGLVSSGIVLLPFNFSRYITILLVGLALFVTSALTSEIIINKNKLSMKETITLTLASLTLAMGIGMMSGGISHFKELPNYVIYLIPLGIIISFMSFVIKNKYDFDSKTKSILMIGVVAIALVVHLGSSYVATNLMGDNPPGGDMPGMHMSMPSK